MDVIEVEGLRLRCVIGVHGQERRGLSDVVIDLRIEPPLPVVDAVDDPASVWDYKPPTKAVIAFVESSTCRTVEALASTIARILIVEHGARSVRVRVHKPGALRYTDSVGVALERTTSDYEPQNRPQRTTAGVLA
ncbi:dihydroneopterin aldolase [Actinomadura harenae]|uniref:dihydroneopterin aldolase n=1 Tax=Actinomadura harenae TaxID=2483351 RepID=A0A3M2LIF8_9ACTN|nr:dihydroneopterin aldolase [Actinomadura harenae]RMI34558.1 dihydroneopterin aldolase [Actinomadura harenae]